jgi:hypothetical protein
LPNHSDLAEKIIKQPAQGLRYAQDRDCPKHISAMDFVFSGQAFS